MSVPSSGSPVPGHLSLTTIAARSGSNKPQPDAITATNAPSMQTLPTRRHDALLQILQEVDALPPAALMKSDLPEQAVRLLAEINTTNESPAEPVRTRRFKLLHKEDSVNRLLARLEIAAIREGIPKPYPIDKDPLRLEAWAAQHNSGEVAAIAKEFPQLRSALSVYLDVSRTNHLVRTFHAGENIDFELDLRSKKTWRFFPGYDAIHHGPAANFIVLVKVMLFLVDRNDSIPLVKDDLKEFIDIRRKDEIASLIQYCKPFSWPDTIAITPESKDFYVAATRNHPVENILFDLIVPIVATHPQKSTLLSLMADMDPSRASWALKPLGFKPTDAMIANAKTPEGREALRQLKNQL